MENLIIENCIFDFTDKPYDTAIKIYCPHDPNLLQRLKCWWIDKLFRHKYMRRKKSQTSSPAPLQGSDVEKAKELCRKYVKATEYYDDLIEGRFVEMPSIARKLVNQVAQEVLDELENGINP